MLIPFTALLSGLVFGLGLILSGMTDPAKVLSFLDVAGLWDPSLMFVMLGAISIGFFAFRAAKRRGRTLLSTPVHLPGTRTIDLRLILGSLLFGMGWGLVGICPGPGLVLAASGHTGGIVFMVAMLLGMFIFDRLEKHRQSDSNVNYRQPGNIERK